MGGNEIDFNISKRKSHRPKDIAESEPVRRNDINIMTVVPIIFMSVRSAPSVCSNGRCTRAFAVILITENITSNAHNAQYGQEINPQPQEIDNYILGVVSGGEIIMLSAAVLLTCYVSVMLSHFLSLS